MPSAIVLLAPGAEEMEATIIVDVLRRGGVEVTLVGVEGPGPVTCSRGLRITPDVGLEQVEGLADAVVLPGGAGGAACLAGSMAVGRLLRSHLEAERIVAAICAAPTALLAHGLASGRRGTSHPSVRAQLEGACELRDERVVEDGRLLTSQGPGTSFEFALALVARLCGTEVRKQIEKPLIL
jgi:protein DJ-1